MAVNTNLLKSKMAINNIKSKDVAKALNITASQLSRKLNNKYDFTVEQIYIIKDLLKLTEIEIVDIFLS